MRRPCPAVAVFDNSTMSDEGAREERSPSRQPPAQPYRSLVWPAPASTGPAAPRLPLSLAVIVNQPTSVGLPPQVDRPKAVRVANCRRLRFGERAVNRCGRSPKAGGPAMERRERGPCRGVAVAPVHLARSGAREVSDGVGLVLVVDRVEPR